MSAIRQDVVHAFRVFRRSPFFYAGLLLTLALGIGANGAVFGILRAVLLQPLPYQDADRIVMVWHSPERAPAATHDILRPAVRRSPPFGDQADRLHQQTTDVLSNLAVYRSWQGNLEAQFDLTLSDHAERLRGMLATANFFDVLGVTAAAGRVFTAADESSNEPVVVLSYALWQRAFGGDRSIIGRPLTLIVGRPRRPEVFTVIGVLPRTFRFTYPDETEAWVIHPWSAMTGRETGFWTVARLAPGVTLAAAQTRVAAIPTWLDPRFNTPERREIFTLQPITEWVVGETRPSMLLLGSVALLLLLITCATVASALFVRMTQRQRELAVRASVGADRRRLVRQLLTEGVALSVAGAALGAAAAALVAPVLRALVPPTVPRADEIAVDGWILVFFAAAAGMTTVLATLAPAWRGARVDLMAAFKAASTGASPDRSTARWRQTLVGLQAAIATALLLTAVLLIVSFWRLSHVPLGFDGERVLTLEMRLIDPKYLPPRPAPGAPPDSSPPPSPALVAFQEHLLAGVRALPGVLEAGLTSAVPFRGVDFVYVLNRVGQTKSVAGNARFVDPGYFSVLKVPLKRGRLFADTDTATSPQVVVISESYARAMFGNDDPIGQRIEARTTAEVVGVVGDMRYQSFGSDPYPAIYFPRMQSPSELICVVARTAPNAGNLGPAIRQVVRALDPNLPAMNLTTVDQIVTASVADRRFYTLATTAFASLALGLTVVGLIVVISRAVAERRRELAIRAALGATASRLVRLIARQGLAPVLVGAGAGLAVAFASARVLQQFLFGVTPRAPLIFAGVAALVVGIAAVAALVPARKAAETAPATALRSE